MVMSHFSNRVLYKIVGKSIRLSVRLSDFHVAEHTIPLKDFHEIVQCKEPEWSGVGKIQAKVKGDSTWLRVFISPDYCVVYSLPNRSFSVLCNEVLSGGF